MLPFFANHYLVTIPFFHFLLNLTIQRYFGRGYILLLSIFLCKNATQPSWVGWQRELIQGFAGSTGGVSVLTGFTA